MEPTANLLIVDDDEGIRTLIGSFLAKNGYAIDTAGDVATMRERLAGNRYDLIILDVMMPGEDGLSALRRLQGVDAAPPVIMLSAVGSDVDRIVGLELGAEDYLPKPCNPRELLARVRTVLRRSERTVAAAEQPPAAPDPGFHFSGWCLNVEAHQLTNPDGKPVGLTTGEFRLLRALVERPRRVLSRDQLLDYAGSADSDPFDRAIDVQVSRLRRRLGTTGSEGEMIRTVRNEGYMFAPVVTKA